MAHIGRQVAGRPQKSPSTLWSPENDELADGIRYINSFAPECDALNEQTFWILTNIKPDSGTPVAGWPEVKVRTMCQNKSRGVSGAVPNNEFPLNTFSLHAVAAEHILPLVYPILLSSAILMLGNPGVGKTPAIITIAMAIGRYHIRRLGLQGVMPGWRRGKSLDNFRQRAPQIQEALFLDDPSSRRLDIADLKSFVTTDEDGTVSGRYNDAKLSRNQLRALASNDIGEEPERVLPSDATLDSEAFFKLVSPLFGDSHKKDILAVMKRSTTLVFTESALYVRLPSECPNAIVHRITKGNVHRDLLADRDKHLYGTYKQRVTVYGISHPAEVEREQAMIDERVEYLAQFPHVKNYVDDCNNKLQKWLCPVRVLPSSPESPEQTEVPGDLRLSRYIGTGPKANRVNRASFVIPGSSENKFRRIRGKSPAPDNSPLRVTTSVESAPLNPDEQDTLVPEVDPDEEAARDMHEA